MEHPELDADPMEVPQGEPDEQDRGRAERDQPGLPAPTDASMNLSTSGIVLLYSLACHCDQFAVPTRDRRASSPRRSDRWSDRCPCQVACLADQARSPSDLAR
jgi:hypothetical protein